MDINPAQVEDRQLDRVAAEVVVARTTAESELHDALAEYLTTLLLSELHEEPPSFLVVGCEDGNP
jgi:hypothetical protein